MIRPLTIATFLMACGSGLYLYQSKHEVQVLDRTIERSVRDTNALREQSRLIAAEWTMLNDPERLRQFSDTYLHLKSISPTQFTSLADLNNRLPAPHVEAPAQGMPAQGMDDDEAAPSATGPQLQPEPAPATVAQEVMPVPPIPSPQPAPVLAAVAPAPVMATMARPAEVRQALARPVMMDGPTRSTPVAEARPAEPRVSESHTAPRIAEARPQMPQPVAPPVRQVAAAVPRPQVASFAPINSTPVNSTRAAAPPMQAASMQAASMQAQTSSRPAVVASQAPYGGSLLGMARGSISPAPRPTPVSATYNSN